jgi:hypothetical protein
MEKEITRHRLTTNLRQLKKYVDEAIKEGADDVRFDMDNQNPYFIFTKDFTPEEYNLFELEKSKKLLEAKITELESNKFRTHSLRVKKYISEFERNIEIEKFVLMNKITDYQRPRIKQVITDEYDDFNDSMETIYITEILK